MSRIGEQDMSDILTPDNPHGMDFAALEKITGTAWHWQLLDDAPDEYIVWTPTRLGSAETPGTTFAVIRYEPGVWDDMLMESYRDDVDTGNDEGWPKPYTPGAYPWTQYYAFTKPNPHGDHGAAIVESFQVWSFDDGQIWEAVWHGPTPEYVAQALADQEEYRKRRESGV